MLLWIGEAAGAGTSSPGEGLVAGVHLVQVIAGLLVATLGAVVLAGCAGQTPAACRPPTPVGGRGAMTRRALTSCPG